MRLPDLVDRYRLFSKREHVKHGRRTSTQCKVTAATRYLLEVEVRGPRLLGREATGASGGTDQLNFVSGGAGEAVRSLADIDSDQLTREDLRDYLDHLLAQRHVKGKRAGLPWTMAHVNSYRGVILRLIEWAEDEGFCKAGLHDELTRCKPIRAGKTVARRSGKVTSAPEEIVFGLVKWLRTTADKLPSNSKYQRDLQRTRRLLAIALELMWQLGCRPQELVLLRLADIVPDPATNPRGELERGWLYLPEQWKTEHEAGESERRIMVVDRRAKQLIDEAVVLRRTDGSQMLLASFDDFDPESRLFTWTASHPYNAVNGLYNAVKRNLARAGLGKFTSVQIRHAFATRCASINVEGTRVQLGHKNLNTTMKYLDADGPAVRDLFSQLEGAKGGPGRPTPPPTSPGRVTRDEPYRLRLVGA